MIYKTETDTLVTEQVTVTAEIVDAEIRQETGWGRREGRRWLPTKITARWERTHHGDGVWSKWGFAWLGATVTGPLVKKDGTTSDGVTIKDNYLKESDETFGWWITKFKPED